MKLERGKVIGSGHFKLVPQHSPSDARKTALSCEGTPDTPSPKSDRDRDRNRSGLVHGYDSELNSRLSSSPFAFCCLPVLNFSFCLRLHCPRQRQEPWPPPSPETYLSYV